MSNRICLTGLTARETVKGIVILLCLSSYIINDFETLYDLFSLPLHDLNSL
jgi:hypothetical protein